MNNTRLKIYSMANRFSRYHGEGNPDDEIVRIEMDEMRVAIETEGSDKVSRSNCLRPDTILTIISGGMIIVNCSIALARVTALSWYSALAFLDKLTCHPQGMWSFPQRLTL
jgi:hypothetical protein